MSVAASTGSGTPRQPTGRQDASNAQPGVLAGLREELRAVAPMLAQSRNRIPAESAPGRLDDIRLDRGVARAERLVGPDAGEVAGWPSGHSAAFRRRTYDPRVVDLDLPPIRLTELTDCGGCAAKLGADLLADALAGLGARGGAADAS